MTRVNLNLLKSTFDITTERRIFLEDLETLPETLGDIQIPPVWKIYDAYLSEI